MTLLEEEEQIDDMTIGLQMQAFLDEWHYRVLHASMATTWNRTQCMVAAMDLFEAQGMCISQEEKWALAEATEDRMVEVLVSRMTPKMRRTFEHFTLQLQLIISTATRVRAALEEGAAKDVQRLVEEGDKGITSHILKQTVVEAAAQVGELRSVHDSWSKNMRRRVDRLARVAHTTDEGRLQLEKINKDIEVFSASQNVKSKTVLLTMVEKTDRTLLGVAWGGWQTYRARYKAEKCIHEKYKKMIDDMKGKVMEFKIAHLKSFVRMMDGRNLEANRTLLVELIRVWVRDAKESVAEKQVEQKVKASQAKLEGLQEAQRSKAKRAMKMFVEEGESALRGTAFQAWVNAMEESRKEKAVSDSSKAMQKQLADMKKKSVSGAKGLMSQIAATTTSGLVHACFTAWRDEYEALKKAAQHEEQLTAADKKFTMMKSSQKAKSFTAADRAIALEKENLLMVVFMNWQGEVRSSRLVRYFRGKMDHKKEQLEQVRQMFNKFATDLGDISTSPRTRATKTDSRRPPIAGGSPAGLPPSGAK